MLTAVDSSVLLDVLVDDPAHADGSERALRQALAEGGLIVCECVIAEVRPSLSPDDFKAFIEDWQLRFVPSSAPSALLAGEMFAAYLSSGGRRGRVLPDFLIAAHAKVHADRLLTRNRGFARKHFRDLKVMSPS